MTGRFPPKSPIRFTEMRNKTPIALMNGEQLVILLMEHGIGVHRSTPDLFEIDEEFVAGGELENA